LEFRRGKRGEGRRELEFRRGKREEGRREKGEGRRELEFRSGERGSFLAGSWKLGEGS
jgi:hypothetical protein